MKALKWVGAKIADNIAGVVITAIGGVLLVYLMPMWEYTKAAWYWFVAPVQVSRAFVILPLASFGLILLSVIIALIFSIRRPQPPAWKSYRQDKFEGALWRWDYNEYNCITNLRPYCLVCDCALNLNRDIWARKLNYDCVSCGSSKDCFPSCSMHDEAESVVRKLIDQRVRQDFMTGQDAAK